MLLENATLVTMAGTDLPGIVTDGVIAIQDAKILWVGPAADLPDRHKQAKRFDAGGRVITPGLIDCHTHLVFGGDRADEFEMRLNGASYEDIAKAGGGIISTVTATRRSDVEALAKEALPRVDAFIAEGVTTLEIKSGYGLDHDTELNMLRAARLIEKARPIRVTTSFLGAHAIPPEYRSSADAYIDEVCIPTLHAAHAEGLVDAVDGFCEGIAFDARQIERVFEAARDLGLPLKLHAEQLSNSGGTQLAANFGALSADHLEYADEKDALVLARAGSVAVMLPGAFYTLGESRRPPIEAFRQHKVPMALATDCNPGSSPLNSLLLAMNMGCTLFRMTPTEVLAGVTCHAAKALGLENTGKIAAGQQADLAIWNVKNPAELPYRIGFNPLHMRMVDGAFGKPERAVST